MAIVAATAARGRRRADRARPVRRPGSDERRDLLQLGGGAALTFVAVALLSPHLVRPLASVDRAPDRSASTGFTGRLARENSIRQPGRTAVTAAALMIGVALVTFASIFAAGAKATIDGAVDGEPQGRLRRAEHRRLLAVLRARCCGPSTASPGVVERQRACASPRPRSRAPAANQSVSSASTRRPSRASTSSTVKKGGAGRDRAARVRRRSSSRRATRTTNDTKVGDTLQHDDADRASTCTLTVSGIVEDKGGLLADLTVTNDARADAVRRAQGRLRPRRHRAGRQPGGGARSGSSHAARRSAIPRPRSRPTRSSRTTSAGQVNQLLGLIYALLSLAVIVSLFGIVNTLVLSISERTRELGMLRAIGTSRKQVKRDRPLGGRHHRADRRRARRASSGVVLAVLFTRPLDDFTLSIPVGVADRRPDLLAGLAGVVAAVCPRAARPSSTSWRRWPTSECSHRRQCRGSGNYRG